MVDLRFKVSENSGYELDKNKLHSVGAMRPEPTIKPDRVDDSEIGLKVVLEALPLVLGKELDASQNINSSTLSPSAQSLFRVN